MELIGCVKYHKKENGKGRNNNKNTKPKPDKKPPQTQHRKKSGKMEVQSISSSFLTSTASLNTDWRQLCFSRKVQQIKHLALLCLHAYYSLYDYWVLVSFSSVKNLPNIIFENAASCFWFFFPPAFPCLYWKLKSKFKWTLEVYYREAF